jgi:hypothetical protein
MRVALRLGLGCAALFSAASLPAQQIPIDSGSVIDTVARLKPGQFAWAPEVAPSGPVLVVVNTRTQRATVFRNGIPIGATTISTGKQGHETPTGVFTILQKQVEHYSSKYDNAPMPYMQRVTWGGVALHAGHLPGYPASHGCIRLPLGFARLLYGVTRVGMTVVITDAATTPRIAAGPEMVAAPEVAAPFGSIEWHPERAPEGPVSIIISAADRRAIVLRNGVVIGAGPVSVDGRLSGTFAYAFSKRDATGQRWIQLNLGGGEDQVVQRSEWNRFRAPEEFRKLVASIVTTGTTVVVTADSLKQGEAGSALNVLEGSDEK